MRLWVTVYVAVMLVLAVGAAVAIRFWWQPAAETPSEETTAADVASVIDAAAAPASGGVLVQAVAERPANFNPLFGVDAGAEAVTDLLYPRLLGQDPHQGYVAPGGLATRWDISPDGLVYTFTLREGVRWSDGAPVQAGDFVFTYRALADPTVNSPYRDRVTGIAQVDAPDPTTVVVTLTAPNCAIVHSLRRPLLPSHRFAPDFSDLAGHPLNRVPEVSAGPFLFVAQDGDRVTLARNPDYYQGAPRLEGWVVQTLADPVARRAALEAGTVDLAAFAPEELAQAPNGDGVIRHIVPTDGYHLLAVNLADPAQPLAGVAADGTRQPQPPHPILGNLTIRQALAAALDGDALIAAGFDGQAGRLGSYVPPMAAWAAAPIPAPSHDPGRATQLLDAAGWTLAADESIRTRDAAPLRLTLLTNADNPLRVELARRIAAQWAQVGIETQVVALGFEELAAELLGQRYDLALIGWEGLGADPANSPFWHSRDDIPGAGFNVSSVQDAEIDAWLDTARQLPGCNLSSRADLYRQVQQRVALLQPALVIAQPWAAWSVSARVQGVAPAPWNFRHNLTTWWIQE